MAETGERTPGGDVPKSVPERAKDYVAKKLVSFSTRAGMDEAMQKAFAIKEREDLEKAILEAKNNPDAVDEEAFELQRHVVKELTKEGLYGALHETAEAAIAVLLVSRGVSPKTAIVGAHAAVELLTSDAVKHGGQGAIDAIRNKIAELRGSGDPEVEAMVNEAEQELNKAPAEAAAGGAGGEGGGGKPPEKPPQNPTPEDGDGKDEEDNKDEIKDKKDFKDMLRDQRDELNNKAQGFEKEFYEIFQNSTQDFGERIRGKVSQAIYDKYQGKNVPPERIEQEINDELQNRLRDFRSKLFQIMNQAQSADLILKNGPEKIQESCGLTIENLLRNGYIDDLTADELRGLVEKSILTQAELGQITVLIGKEEDAISTELRRAIYNGQVEFTPDQESLLYALDSPEKLAEYINSNQRYLDAGTEWYKLFYQDIGDVFESILSIASSQPNEPFMQNISMMYEGALHKFLVGRLKTNLPRALEQQKDKDYVRLDRRLTGQAEGTPKEEWVSLATFKVIETQIRSLSKESDSIFDAELRGKEIRSYKFDHSIDFFRGVEILGDKMAKNLERTQVLHDTEVAERLGLGFEELAKSAERLRQEDIDEMTHGNTELARTFRAYKQQLDLFLALKGHVITTDFGEIYKYMGLDNIQGMTFQSMYGHIKRNEGESDLIYERRVKGLIRQAAGLAKVTMAYHAQLLPRRLLISRKIEHIKDGLGRITGIKKVAKKLTYVSARIAALETNLTEFDPRKLMDRFDIPNSLPAILSAFVPKFKKKYDPWRDQYRHADILKHAEENDEAFFIGRIPWLARFDRTNRTLGDITQIKTIDRFLRGGWRDVQYDVYEVKKSVPLLDENGEETGEQKEVVDLSATIDNLRRFGTVFVARFIDDKIDDFVSLERDDPFFNNYSEPEANFVYSQVLSFKSAHDQYSRAKEVYETAKKEKKHKERARAEKRMRQIEEDILTPAKLNLRTVLYEKEVLKPLFQVRPTQALAFEFNRYTPRKEYLDGRTVYQQIYHFMREKFPNVNEQYLSDEVLPFFASTLTSIENAEWDRRRPDRTSILRYTLTPEMINEHLSEPMFEFYMSQLGSNVGINRDGFDENYKFETFREDLAEFSSKLQQATFDTVRYRGLNDDEDERITFARRYAELLLVEEREEIEIILASAIDVANEEYIMQQSGSRVTQRTLGEAKQYQSEVGPAWKKLLLGDIFDVGRQGLETEEEIEKAAETLHESVHKHVHLVESLHGEAAAYKDTVDLGIIIWDRLFGKDRIYRGAMGSFFGTINREIRGRAESLFQTINPKTPEMTSTALDTDRAFIGVKHLLNKVGVPWKEKTIIGYEDEVVSEKAAERISTVAGRLDKSVGRIPAIGKRISRTLGWKNLASDPKQVLESFTTASNNRVTRWVMNIAKPGLPITHINPDNGEVVKKVIGMTWRDAAIEDWPKLFGLAALVLIAAALAANEEEKKK